MTELPGLSAHEMSFIRDAGLDPAQYVSRASRACFEGCGYSWRCDVPAARACEILAILEWELGPQAALIGDAAEQHDGEYCAIYLFQPEVMWQPFWARELCGFSMPFKLMGIPSNILCSPQTGAPEWRVWLHQSGVYRCWRSGRGDDCRFEGSLIAVVAHIRRHQAELPVRM